MAQPQEPPEVKLICGLISHEPALLERAIGMMERLFSAVDVRSDVTPFDFTHYYDSEMGSPLFRQFVSFKRCISPEAIVQAKIATNAIEAQLAAELAGPGLPTRPVNLDPGYLDEARLVLASMKKFSHRIYLSGGVYAELTLLYHKGRWDALNWTFPDYASGRYHGFLSQARNALRQYLHSDRNGSNSGQESE